MQSSTISNNIERNLVIKPTWICNLNCPTCMERRILHKNLKNNNYTMTLYDYDNLIHHAQEIGFNTITISGAEPLFYKQFNELCEIINNSSYTWKSKYLMTNGYLLDRYIDTINKTFTSLQISFGDIKLDSFVYHRGSNNCYTFDRIQDNVISYHKTHKKIQTVNCVVLTKKRLLNLNNILVTSQLLNFDNVNLQLLEGNFNINNKYKITQNDLDSFKEIIYPKIKRYITDKIISVISLEYLDSIVYTLEKYVDKKVYRDYTNDNSCTIPNNLVIVLPNGDVHPCNIVEYTHDYTIGNLRTNNLKFMLDNSLPHFLKNRSKCHLCPMLLH